MATSPPPTQGAPVGPSPPLSGRNPRTVRLIVAVVAIALVLSGITIVYIFTRPTACRLSSSDPLIFDQPEQPDTLDPQVTFSTPGWGLTQQVYQTLVMYNGSSYTEFSPILAKSWTESSDHFNLTFTLRSGVHFSNGDPFNAYVMWYSLNRALVMNLDPAFILSQNFNYPHVNASSTSDEVNASVATLETNLNSFDFTNPTASQLAYMKDPWQSFQVIDDRTIQLNMGSGYLGDTVAYAYIFSTLAAPIAAAVDPVVIKANGGVHPTTNDWMSTNLLGTGPYKLASYTPSSGFLLQPDPTYWGASDAAKEPWNNFLQPAKSSIQVNFQSDTAKTTTDLKTGAVAGASFAYLGPSTVNDLKGAQCVTVKALDLVYSSTAGAWWIYMNQNHEPFNNRSVRAAIAHAINYQQINATAFGGNSVRWVGPVPPQYPYYNPDNLAPYAYNLTLARQFMSNSPWPTGYPTPIKYAYIDLGDWFDVSSIIKANLAQIGITLELIPITLDNLYQEQARDNAGVCTTETSANGGPFYMGQEFYTSDYISPNDWTQNNALSDGSANDCMSQFVDANVDQWVIQAAGESNPTVLRSLYANMVRTMYDNYTNVWLLSPTQFSVSNPLLAGVVPNPMGSALPFTMSFNTEYAAKPT
ncbi:MAG TPA: ABC transporter substrate-binding protein [Thermoplasmata archaeon]|nr:ABC transporter substrate-binding protein [Thermoplasmata archaeon]